MNHTTPDTDKLVYDEPKISDYGTVEDLTEAGGTHFQDVPIGTAAGNVTIGSTP